MSTLRYKKNVLDTRRKILINVASSNSNDFNDLMIEIFIAFHKMLAILDKIMYMYKHT